MVQEGGILWLSSVIRLGPHWCNSNNMGQYYSCSTGCWHLCTTQLVTILNMVGAVKNTVAHTYIACIEALNLKVFLCIYFVYIPCVCY